MPITLDAATEQRIQHQLTRGPYRDPSELLSHALDLLTAEEEWLFRNREAINDRLEASFAEAERGEGFTMEEARALLTRHRSARSA